MKEITDKIYLRPVTPEEEQIWRDIFFDSVREHFSVLNLPENNLNQLLEMQYQAQKTDYQKNYSQAENNLIFYENEIAGRLITSTERGDLHVIDLIVLSDYRNRGIGTTVLNWLFDESRRSGLKIRFSVEKNNRALQLYERLGFKIVGEIPTHFRMEWSDQADSSGKT